MATLETAKQRGWSRIVLAGASDLAEIAAICALEGGITIVGIVDSEATQSQLIGTPIYRSFAELSEPFDGVMVTDLKAPQETFDTISDRLGAGRVIAPILLGISPHNGVIGSAQSVAGNVAK
jgi:hypothetical protein